jgi:hypothetical protein
MQVIDALAAILPAVPDEPVSRPGDPAVACHFRRHQDHVTGQGTIFANQIVKCRHVYTWDDEDVHRSLRAHVFDRNHLGVLVHVPCGDFTADDPTEDARRIRAARASHRFTIAAAGAPVKQLC